MDSILDLLAARGILWVGAALAVLLLAAHEAARLIGQRRPAEGGRPEALSVTVGGMLALVGFMLAITFSIAEDRFEERRLLVVQEANAIGTAWLRAGAVGGSEGETVRALLTDYARVRAAYTATGAEGMADVGLRDRTDRLQAEIWAAAGGLARRDPNPLNTALLTALNEAFDAATAQHHAFASRVPTHVKGLLVLGSLIAAGGLGFLLGCMGERHRVPTAALMVLWPGAMMLIVDLNRPRQGTLRTDAAPLEWTLRAMAGERP